MHNYDGISTTSKIKTTSVNGYIYSFCCKLNYMLYTYMYTCTCTHMKFKRNLIGTEYVDFHVQCKPLSDDESFMSTINSIRTPNLLVQCTSSCTAI